MSVNKPNYSIKCDDNIFIRYQNNELSDVDIWFVHGLGESGLSFIEAFNSSVTKVGSLYIPDLPGSGVSPSQNKVGSCDELSQSLLDLIKKQSGKKKICLVVHSFGSIITSNIACHLSPIAFINIDGVICSPEITTTYSHRAFEYDNPENYYNFIKDSAYENAAKSEAQLRYLASLIFCEQEPIYTLAKTGLPKLSLNQYAHLAAKKMYFLADDKTKEAKLNYLKSFNLDYMLFENCSHWIMEDAPDKCYNEIHDFILNCLK